MKLKHSNAFAIALLAASGVLAFTDPAAAQAFGKLQTILDSVKDAMTGPIGRTLAIIGVAMVGLAWVFGQMDVRRAGTVVVGIAIIFGAAEIVAAMAG
jgi:type IV secretory pathway VirB2 component (pilin)